MLVKKYHDSHCKDIVIYTGKPSGIGLKYTKKYESFQGHNK